MESLISYFSDLGLDLLGWSKISLLVLLGALLICAVSWFIFRKKTLIGHAVSSAIAIIFICVIAVLIMTLAPSWSWLIAPLPFVELSDGMIRFFDFHSAGFPTVASQLLSMVILAFLVNLLDIWIPKGKKFFPWLFLRCATVFLGFGLHYLVTWLFARFLPHVIVVYAPVVLLCILILMLLTGALKLLVGLFLTTINPLIGTLYTFFFANVIGRQITQAVLTTALLSGLILLLQNMGIAVLSLAAGVLVVYIPFLLVLIAVWFVVNKLL